VLFSTVDGSVHALNAKTGTMRWSMSSGGPVVKIHNKAAAPPSGHGAPGNKSEKLADGEDGTGAEDDLSGPAPGTTSGLVVSGARAMAEKGPLDPFEQLEILPIYEDGGKLGFKQGSAVKARIPRSPTPCASPLAELKPPCTTSPPPRAGAGPRCVDDCGANALHARSGRGGRGLQAHGPLRRRPQLGAVVVDAHRGRRAPAVLGAPPPAARALRAHAGAAHPALTVLNRLALV
jgi:hypothetical protein